MANANPNPYPAAVPPDAVEEARRHLESVEGVFVVATEWGLFRANEPLETELRAKLCEMARLLSAGAVTWQTFAEFECLLVETWAKFNRAMSGWNAHAFYYRLNAHWGVFHVALALISSLVAAWAVAWGVFDGSLTAEVLRAPVFAGIVGALLKSLYWTQFQNGQGALRPRFFSYFLASGMVGAILGWASSLLIEVSFRVLATGGNAPEPDWKVLALVAIFSGFRWEWVLSKLEKGVEAITEKFLGK